MPRPKPSSENEIVYGLRASLALLGRREDDILRVGYSHDVHQDARALVEWAGQHRVHATALGDADLDQIAGSSHHEGLVVETRPRRFVSPADLASLLVEKRGFAVALDRVRNPYNTGAILRTAAFFGADAALLGAQAPHPALPPLAVRVAEGGAESLALSRTTDLAGTLARLRAGGVKVVGTDGHSDVLVQSYAFPRPLVIVLGHEREGVGGRVREQCDAVVAIRGGGQVESLNVAAAAAVMLAEAARRGGPVVT